MGNLEKIRDTLKKHIGKHNRITSSQMASILGTVEDATHAQTRAEILEAAQKYGLPLRLMQGDTI